MAKSIKTRSIPLDRETSKEDRRKNGVRRWTDFYRQNAHRCISSHFKCETLTWWQDMIIYLMFKSSVFFAIMCRGIGKSFLVAWFMVVWCTIFPRSRIVIASGTRGQSRLIITQKILGEIYNRYPKVRQEIDLKNSNLGMNDTFVKFYNGSEIVVITGGDSSRGNRAMIVVYEESRTLEIDVIKNVLSKMKQNGERRPRYKDNPKYMSFRAKEEKKKDIHISSGWFQSHHLYSMCNDAYESMLDGKSQAVLSLHWGFPTVEGFMDYEEDILKEKNASDYSKMWWDIENCGLFWNQSEKSIYGHNELTKLRKIKHDLKPIPNELYLDKKAMSDWKKRNYIKKEDGEIRILSCDIAVMGGDRDNTVFTCIRGIPVNGHYKKYVSYVEHHSNAHSEEQSIRMKQLYYDLEIDIICLDLMGAGVSVGDAASKVQYDTSRDVEYKAFTVFNREDMKDRVFNVDIADAVPCIYGIKQSAQINHYLITWLKSAIENGRIEFLMESNKMKDILDDKKIDQSDISKMIRPYIETDFMIKEMTALEVSTQPNSPYLKVDNPSLRKDRFSSLSFGVYYLHLKEAELLKEEQSYDEDDDIIDIYYTNSPIY